MARETHTDGVQVDYDDRLFSLSIAAPAALRRRGGVSFDDAPELLTPAPDEGAARRIVDSLIQRGVIDRAGPTLVLSAGPAAPADAKRAATPAAPTRVTVPLAAGEQAVMLVEGDGVLAWRFGRPTALAASTTRLQRGAADAPQRALEFEIDLPPIAAPVAGAARRGWLRDRLIDGAKAIVLYFAAEVAADGVVRLMERKRRNGAVVINSSTDPGRWLLPDDWSAVKLPVDRPAKVLLLVHGTFSSTIGGFGELTATPWGQRLLTAALGRYDAVLGQDHRSLSLSPTDNADALLALLRTLPTGRPVEVDAICHSRGGLVLRTLTERLLPSAGLAIVVKRAIFVAATNHGTELARPANWETLVDLVTNLSAVTSRVLSLFPASAPAAQVTHEVIASIGEFVKYLVEVAVEHRQIPGLAAMDPGGEFVLDLNKTQPRQPAPGDIACYAIVSDFRARLLDSGEHEPKELPKRLAFVLADGVIDRLMRGDGDQAVPNDLVVDVASMTDIDAAVGGFVKDVLDFGNNAQVYHTNYFMRPETAGRLAQWLQLPSPLDGIDPMRLAGAQRRVMAVRADASVGEAQAQLDREAPDFMVIVRQDPAANHRKLLHYAVKPGEFRAYVAKANADVPVVQAFDLHESERSGSFSPGNLPFGGISGRSGERRPHVRRGVVVDAGRPTAVLDQGAGAADIDQLVAMAHELQAPLAAAAPSALAPARPSRGGDLASRPSASARGPTPAGKGVASKAAAKKVAAKSAPARTTAPGKPPTAADLHVTAEMPREVTLGRDAIVSVTLSAEALAVLAGQVSDRGHFTATVGELLTVHVIPRRGFDYAPSDKGGGQAEVPVPGPGAPAVLDFSLRANELGDGEVSVAVRQGAVRKLMLTLRPGVVENAATSRSSTSSSAVLEDQADCGLCATLEIFDRRNAGQLQYEFILKAGNVHDRFRSEPIQVEPRHYVEARYDEIEKAWLGSDRAVDRFAQRLETICGQMFRQLFPLPLKQALWRLAGEGQLDGIQVHSDEPFLPWEVVFLDDPAAPAASGKGRFFGDLGLCRWLYGTAPVCSISVRPGRARFVIPHYPRADLRLAQAEEVEEPFLTKQLGALAVLPRHAEIVDLLKGPGSFDLLHFACHGKADPEQIDAAALMLQGEVIQTAQGATWSKETLLASTVDQYADLRTVDGGRPLVVVNACQTGRLGYSLTGLGGFATAFLGTREGSGDSRGRAGAFIGALWSVGDEPASTFVSSLYTALKVGQPMAAASRTARAAARSAGEGSWLAYAVYAHPGLKLRFL